MDLKSGVFAAARRAPVTAIDALERVRDKIASHGALDNERRVAHLIGQCAHESLDFTRDSESLFYTTIDRLWAIFSKYFRDRAHAKQYLRNSEKLANLVYANRMGNGIEVSGDGYLFRGRGYLQLSGRSNYRIAGNRIGVDLVANPDQAKEPEIAWRIAVDYLVHRKRMGKTAFEWADNDNVEAVTRIVNGGTNGLEDRRTRTMLALTALGGLPVHPLLRLGKEGESVLLLQKVLAAKGFSPGAIDGDFSPLTDHAVRAFQASVGLKVDGVVGNQTWAALDV